MVRAPHPSLRPFVRVLWAIEPDRSARLPGRTLERVLPTGRMHLAVRLSDHPLRLFANPGHSVGTTLGHAIVGGARSEPYVRDISEPGISVGAELQPGASDLLFGVPASELAHRHTPLEALWGRRAGELRERLSEARSVQQRLDLFESLLAERLPRVRGVHPAVAHALERFLVTSDVGEVVRQTGYSHRRFLGLFREAVGLGPKVYCRVLRFDRLLEACGRRSRASWAEAALDAGYSDQPHLNREFRQFGGMTPGEYRLAGPLRPHHVPIGHP